MIVEKIYKMDIKEITELEGKLACLPDGIDMRGPSEVDLVRFINHLLSRVAAMELVERGDA